MVNNSVDLTRHIKIRMAASFHKQDFLASKDISPLNKLIDTVFSECLGIAYRYCKTDEQARELSKTCFLSTLKKLLERKEEKFDTVVFLKEYRACIVQTLMQERKGALIADTIIVSAFKTVDENLFAASDYYKTLQATDLIQHIRKLNILQQIIYNLICIDKYSVSEAAQLLQHSELSIKALIEKAKHHLHTSIKQLYND